MKPLVLVLLLLLSNDVIAKEKFDEELVLKPLASGDLSAHFRFTTVVDASDGVQRDFHLFPRALGELIEAFSLRELDLSLTRGVWREALWGYSPQSAPAGAMVSAWFEPSKVNNVDNTWLRLTNALAGQLCATLNFLETEQTAVSPQFSFNPRGVQEEMEETLNHTFFRLGFLPGENVCTENLSPWKKLLPCEAKRGLATLLNARSIHRTKYHSIGLSLRYVCSDGDCSRRSVELVQSVTLVFSPETWPENCDKDQISWSIRSLFGIGLMSKCPLADNSGLIIDTSIEKLKFEQDVDWKQSGDHLLIANLNDMLSKGQENLIVSYKKSAARYLYQKPVLTSARFITGYGEQKGKIVTKITNNHKKSLKIVYLDILPWYLRLYFHTLKVTTSAGGVIQPQKSVLKPGVDRSKPYSIELVLQLPPKSVTKVSIDFEKSILKWLEYPPDANHGFYVGPATIAAFLPSRANFTSLPQASRTFLEMLDSQDHAKLEESDSFMRIFTETLLVNLPTPDFSMPYNVICLTCTVVALAFGPLHNITTKELKIEKDSEKKPTLLQKVKSKVTSLFKKQGESSDQMKSKDHDNDE